MSRSPRPPADRSPGTTRERGARPWADGTRPNRVPGQVGGRSGRIADDPHARGRWWSCCCRRLTSGEVPPARAGPTRGAVRRRPRRPPVYLMGDSTMLIMWYYPESQAVISEAYQHARLRELPRASSRRACRGRFGYVPPNVIDTCGPARGRARRDHGDHGRLRRRQHRAGHRRGDGRGPPPGGDRGAVAHLHDPHDLRGPGRPGVRRSVRRAQP